MAGRRWPAWSAVLWAVAWLVLLALLPWWLGLPLLLALAAAVWLLPPWLRPDQAELIRRGLRWGLPGVMFALQRALGGDAFAWGAALLGALVGYTMLAGLEAWLDRDIRRAPPAPATAEWPELAMTPIGPAAEIIELQSPLWRQAGEAVGATLGELPAYHEGDYRFADGSVVTKVGPHAASSPAGGWFAARMHGDRGVVLFDRTRDRKYRLRGWQLRGWYREQPWLSRREDDMPLSLSAVLGQDED